MDIINVGTNEDGTPHLFYNAPGEHVVITPSDVAGSVRLPDGSLVDVTARVVVVDSPEQAVEVVQAIAEQHQGAEPGADVFMTPVEG